jgi:predicted neuraminidase
VARGYNEDGPPQWDWQDVIHARPLNLEAKYPAALDEVEKLYGPFLQASEEHRQMLAGLREAVTSKLTRRLGWMTRLHPIMTSENRMMLGLYSDVFNCSLAAFTEDWGKTWQFSEPILTPELGNIQPSFVMRRDGAVVAMMRDNGLPKRIRRAESKDQGVTWGPVEHMDISNPGSSVECIGLQNGNWALVCNDTRDGRHLMTVYLSDDEGVTWKWKRSLADFGEKDAGSASYPSVIQGKDGSIHCTYSYTVRDVSGSSIKHAHFNEAWIQSATQ